MNFCGRTFVGLSGAVSLVSLSGCSRVAFSSVCMGSFVVLGFYLLVASLLVGSPLHWLTGIHNSHLVLYALAQLLVNKAVLPDNQTYARGGKNKQTNLYHISNLNLN